MTYPQIGSKYSGPSLSRPALRQLPIYWHLSDKLPDARRWQFWRSGDAWVGLLAIAGLFWICIEILAGVTR